MEDKRTGEVHDYSRKRGVTVSAAFFPSGVDCSWATKSEILWNTAELAEKRKDARLGREIVLALPSELSPTERKALAAEMAQHVADRYGVAVDAAIHAPSRQGDDRNFHVHMLVSARRITSKGFGEKARELDDRERGPAEVEHLRAKWARLANRALEQAGQHVQIDHRSFRRQGVKRMPSRHLGASATALERRGIKTRIGDGNRAAARLNALAGQLEAEQAACVSLTEQAKRAAQEVRQCGVDISREASSVSRAAPAMPRPTPQRAAEAPQRPVAAQQAVAPRPTPQRAVSDSRLFDLKIAANIAMRLYNGSVKDLLEGTKFPIINQRNIVLNDMRLVGIVDKNDNVIEEKVRIRSDDEKEVENFCALKKYLEKSPKLEELSSSGVWKTLKRYSHVVERLEKEREQAEQQWQCEIEQEQQMRAAEEAKRQAELERALELEDDEWER